MFTGSNSYGIYRDRWYTLDEYINTFFNPNYNRTIGILESTMYISSQQLHPCYSIIESLESRGYNVIPVFAAGGSSEQLKVMVESWTNAGGDISGFLADSSKFDVYVDAIVVDISEPKKTKKGVPFVDVTLMDKNKDTIVRRFPNPPEFMVGTFKIQPNETKFFMSSAVKPFNFTFIPHKDPSGLQMPCR
jgi:hypothetical protein